MDLTHLTSAELVFGSEVEGTDPQLRSERSPLFSAQLSKLIRLGVAAGNGPPVGRDFPSGQGSTTGINLLATGNPFPEGRPTPEKPISPDHPHHCWNTFPELRQPCLTADKRGRTLLLRVTHQPHPLLVGAGTHPPRCPEVPPANLMFRHWYDLFQKTAP